MHKFNQKGATILVVVVFIMIFLSILTAYVLKTYYKSQQTEYDIDKIEHHYNLETNLQRAVSLVKSEGRKDLSDTNSFNQNWLGTYGTDFIIEVKEFTNWDGYVINNNEALNEVNGTSDSITWSNPVSIKIISQVFDKELEYLIRKTGGTAFTIYAHNNFSISQEPNYYPYLPGYTRNDDFGPDRISNDVRIENSDVFYNNQIVSYDGSSYDLDGKFDSVSSPQQNTLSLPYYFNDSYDTFAQYIRDNYSSYIENDTNISFTFDDTELSTLFSGQLYIYLIGGDLTINLNRDITNTIDQDVVFIVGGDVYVEENFWVGNSGRIGIINWGTTTFENTSYYYEFFETVIDFYSHTIGGNIFSITQGDIIFKADEWRYRANWWRLIIESNGNYTILGKLYSVNNIQLTGTDFIETTSEDFSNSTTLRGLNITDNPNIFTSPRNLPFDIGFNGPQAEIWREN